ncbi:response regulator [Methanohalophilus profundi]|uniref:response regulator n=1 Tax=Methanohalophilus profundi TaxID=2138083 RepID=UPI00101DF6CA|nr:response regulator [Methanohalophilus profundi]
MKTKSVLIVEDEIIIAMGLKLKLENQGYIVRGIVSDGQTAIKTASCTGPDIILMDIILKGDMDGIEVAGKIKQNSSIPIIFITGISDKETLRRAHKIKPVGLLTKPYSDRHLFKKIELALSKDGSFSNDAQYTIFNTFGKPNSQMNMFEV